MSSSFIHRASEWLFSFKALKFLLFGCVCLVTIVFLGIAIFNWREERLWQAVVAQHRFNGEPVDLQDVVPAAVPDDQNFAMTPMLAPLFAFDPKIPGDFGIGSPKRSELISGDVLRTTSERRTKGGPKITAPSMGHWRTGDLTDLAAWQDYYVADESFKHPRTPGKPGADILFALQESSAQIAELEQASQRMYAAFKVHYETENPAAVLLPHLALLKRFNAYCVLSGIAALSEGKSDLALARARVGFSILRSVEADPILISYLVHIALWDQLTQLLWEGVARHAWSSDQLELIQKEVARVRPASGGIKAMVGERAFGNAIYERFIHSPTKMVEETQGMWGMPDQSSGSSGPGILNAAVLIPRGVFRMNQRLQDSIVSRSVEGMRALEKTPGFFELPPGELPSVFEEAPSLGKTGPGNMLARLFAPSMQRFTQRVMQAEVNQRVVAVGIALERHFQANKEYPTSLDKLSPQWISTPITDPFNGQPLHYRRTSRQRMVVYSVGWDLQDAGGAWPATNKDIENASPSNRKSPSRKPDAIDDIVWANPKE